MPRMLPSFWSKSIPSEWTVKMVCWCCRTTDGRLVCVYTVGQQKMAYKAFPIAVQRFDFLYFSSSRKHELPHRYLFLNSRSHHSGPENTLQLGCHQYSPGRFPLRLNKLTSKGNCGFQKYSMSLLCLKKKK